ncbi:MAG TPA: hypothetical protein VMW62_12845 [Chloroflexota bacterium]|nr:hypothetical protein [Chloroflexota bacterium]
MVFTRGKKFAIGGTVAALFVAGGVYASTAFAQSTSPSANPSGQQAFVSHLASRLGISDTSKVQQALKDAAKDSVADQVAAGKITQTQATKIDQRIDSGQGGPFGFGRGPGGPGRNGMTGGSRGMFGGGQILNAAAGALNITPDALRQQIQSGKSLKDIAGSNWPAVQQAMTTAAKAQLDPRVSSGKITSTQEQNIITRLTSGNFPRPHGPRPSGSASATTH